MKYYYRVFLFFGIILFLTVFGGDKFALPGQAENATSTPYSNPSGAVQITASVVSSRQINLYWTLSTTVSGTAAYYHLYRNGNRIMLSDTASYARSYENKELTASTTYSYYIIAYNANNGIVGYSYPVYATTQPEPPPSPCNELWTCGDWSSCGNDGAQIRTCADANQCDTINTKPALSQNCAMTPPPPTPIPCTESWTCAGWSSCGNDGAQTRTCADANNCGTINNRPLLNQSCAPPPPPPPKFNFIYPKNNAVLAENQIISIESSNTKTVEFYLQLTTANEPFYLGQAVPDGEIWRYAWNTNSSPNNDYYLYAKIIGINSNEYRSEKNKITVKNEIPRNIQKEQETAQQITEEQKTITQTTEAKKQEAKQETAKQILETIPSPPEEKPAIQKDITTLMESFPPENKKVVEEIINKVGQIVEPEKQEETKQKITEYLSKLETALEIKETEKSEKERKIYARDTDQDEISDYQEIAVYKTDPFNADSDGDSFIDGLEILSGYDPKNPSPAAKVVFEEPKTSGVEKPEVLKVNKVELVDIGSGKKGIELKGKSLPRAFVVLYIYSDIPLIVTVKTDEYGNWTYILDKPLEEGRHEVYAAITNNTGKIFVKSQPFSFIKEAQAVTALTVGAEEESSQSSSTRNYFMVIIAGLIFLAVSIAIFFIIKASRRTTDINATA